METQLADFGIDKSKWQIQQIIGHTGTLKRAMFLAQWKSGDKTWIPYHQLVDYDVLPEYLDALGVQSISDLKNSYYKGLDTRDDFNFKANAVVIDPAPPALELEVAKVYKVSIVWQNKVFGHYMASKHTQHKDRSNLSDLAGAWTNKH